MNKVKLENNKRIRRHRRVRAKIKGTESKPRLSVFRSHKHIYVQLIDDEKGRTILSSSDFNLSQGEKGEIKDKKLGKMKVKEFNKVSSAYITGKSVAKKALSMGIKKVVFDKGSYKYHGRVEAIAEGARDGGLNF